jgi:hypothetical protein
MVMKIDGSRRKASLTAAVLALLGWSLAAAPAAAEAGPWTFRLRGSWSDFARNTSASGLSGATYQRLSGARGIELGAEVRLAEWAGIELALGRQRLDATVRTTEWRVVSVEPFDLEEVETSRESGPLEIDQLSATWWFHPVRRGRFDLAVGPLLALARFDAGVTSDRDEELGWGGRLGFDVALGEGSPWSLGAEYRYVEWVHDSQSDRDLDGDLGIGSWSVALGWRTGGAR